jgi:hypothetical protein
MLRIVVWFRIDVSGLRNGPIFHGHFVEEGPGAYFGWVSSWDLNPEWRSRGLKDVTGGRHFGEAAFLRGNAGRAPSFELYPGILLTTEEKSRKNLRQGSINLPAGKDSGSRPGCRNRCRDRLYNLQHPWIAFQVDQVNPQSVEISAELSK